MSRLVTTDQLRAWCEATTERLLADPRRPQGAGFAVVIFGRTPERSNARAVTMGVGTEHPRDMVIAMREIMGRLEGKTPNPFPGASPRAQLARRIAALGASIAGLDLAALTPDDDPGIGVLIEVGEWLVGVSDGVRQGEPVGPGPGDTLGLARQLASTLPPDAPARGQVEALLAKIDGLVDELTELVRADTVRALAEVTQAPGGDA